jgi:large subunit ribosomal protein L35Ae
MEGVIKNYRRGRNTQYTDQAVVEIGGVKSKKDASAYVGKTLVWKSTAGREISGKVMDTHGNTGALRVKFQRGLPGQAIGQKVSFSD